MSTRKLNAGVLQVGRVGILGAVLLLGSIALGAPSVPYGAPLPPPGQGGGPGGPGGPGRGGGGFRFGGFPTIGQIATVTGSTFTVSAMSFDGSTNTVTVKTTPTTVFIDSTDSDVNDIAVGDTLQVRGRPDQNDPNTIDARQITDGTVGLPPTPPTPPAGAAAPPPGGGGGFGARFAPRVGVVTAITPDITIKGTDGTTYTIDTSNDPTVSKTTAGTISDIVTGKYAIVMAVPPATPPPPPAPGTPFTPPTNVTAQQVTISDTAPQFGRRGGGGGGGGGGAPPPPAQ